MSCGRLRTIQLHNRKKKERHAHAHKRVKLEIPVDWFQSISLKEEAIIADQEQCQWSAFVLGNETGPLPSLSDELEPRNPPARDPPPPYRSSRELRTLPPDSTPATNATQSQQQHPAMPTD